MDIPEGTLANSATFNSPLPLTFSPDGLVTLDPKSVWRKSLFVLPQNSQKMEVEKHNKRRSKTATPASDYQKLQKILAENAVLKTENAVLKVTIKNVEKKTRVWGAERKAMTPFLQELVQVSGMSKNSPFKYSMEFKVFCAQIYAKSPGAYKLLTKTMPFPSDTAVNQVIRLEKLSRPADWEPPKHRPKRFHPDQVLVLRAQLQQDTLPSKERVKELAQEFQCKETKVAKWFEYKRAQIKAEADDLKRRILRGELDEPLPEPPMARAPSPPQEKLPRYVLRSGQLTILNKWYEALAIPSSEDFDAIAKEACLDIRRCKKWYSFENRRCRDGRERRRSTGNSDASPDDLSGTTG